MNLIDKIQKKHTEVLDFYSSEKLTERERNLLRTEMAFLLELKSDAEALNIDLVSGCFSFAKHFKQNYEFHQYTTEGKETYITDTGVVRTEDEVMEHWKTYYR